MNFGVKSPNVNGYVHVFVFVSVCVSLCVEAFNYYKNKSLCES